MRSARVAGVEESGIIEFPRTGDDLRPAMRIDDRIAFAG
jgi:hypothetical protein